jgi:3D (Asp-Asp-Asp) domain-containing protein
MLPIEVEATVYRPVVGQTDDTPDITASGKKINLSDPLSHRWIAVSRDLESEGFVFGRKLSVKGTGTYDGIWTVQDRMNRRWTKRIDFLIGIDDPLGKWDSVIIKLID